MSQKILIAAVEFGGSIRSFEQRSVSPDMKGNCMVHSARWLRAKRKQGDFISKYGTHVVQNLRNFNVPDTAQIASSTDAPSKGYNWFGPGLYEGRVYLTFQERKTSDAVETRASQIRAKIKPDSFSPYQSQLDHFIEGGRKKLDAETEPRMLFRKNGDSKEVLFGPDWQTELLPHFSAPGYYFGAFIGTISHAVAFLVTEKEFWYFDPVCGELKLDLDQVKPWLAHKDVGTYFTNERAFISITNYIADP